MIVSIEFLGSQLAVTKVSSIDMPISGKTMVNDALDYVRNNYPDLKIDEDMILIAVNHEIASIDRVLEANDTVSFLPAIGGG